MTLGPSCGHEVFSSLQCHLSLSFPIDSPDPVPITQSLFHDCLILHYVYSLWLWIKLPLPFLPLLCARDPSFIFNMLFYFPDYLLVI